MPTDNTNNLTTLDQFIDQHIGRRGETERETFEIEYDTFKLGVMLQQAREARGLSQTALAMLAEADESQISKLESNMDDVSLATLYRIVTKGLGGRLKLSIEWE